MGDERIFFRGSESSILYNEEKNDLDQKCEAAGRVFKLSVLKFYC